MLIKLNKYIKIFVIYYFVYTFLRFNVFLILIKNVLNKNLYKKDMILLISITKSNI